MNASPLLLVLLLARSQQAGRIDGDSFVSKRLGFRIERPGREWAWKASEAGPSFTLAITEARSAGKVQASVRVKSVLDGSSSGVLKQALARIEGKAAYSELETFERKLAGRRSPGLSVRYRTGGTTWRIRQQYLVEGGLRFVLQVHAPAELFDKFARDFERIRASLRLLPATAELRKKRRLAALAARCGSEIRWAESWEQAAERAREERKLVLVLVRWLGGFKIPDQALYGAFMNPDLIELVGERFVALRLEKHMNAPFRSRKSYGMSGSTFGSALLVVSPAGKVLCETFSLDPHAAYAFLLDAAPGLSGQAALPAGDDLSRAERLVRRGELDRAMKLLGDASSAGAQLLRASIHRRRRQGAQALEALGRARAAGGDPPLVALEEARVLVRLGREDEARDRLRGITTGDPGLLARTFFWRGVLDRRADPSRAPEPWQQLTEQHPDSRFAWQAAALLDIPSYGLPGRIRSRWPRAEVLASLRPAIPARNTRIREIQRDAVAFVLRSQRADGSWISPTELGKAGDPPNPFVVAITAICGQSMLERGQTEGCREAAGKALGFVLGSHTREKKEGKEPFYMDYTVWSNAYALWFLADCVAAGLGEPESLHETMRQLVEQLGRKQKPGGGWSYYVTRDLASVTASPSISFVTACVVLALGRAREAGTKVPRELLAAGLDCLERARNPNGAFDYFVKGGKGAKSTGRPGAAGRGPVCELALHRQGRGSLDRIRQALEIFREHRAGLARQLGKVLMHAGPDGQGCHYLMFDYAFAAAACAELPAAERARHRSWILELLLAARSGDGRFRDTMMNGWAFGTAMALQALRDLEPPGR